MTIADEALSRFEEDITSYEEKLFGLALFYDTMPRVIRWTNALSFRKMTRRGKAAINVARQLLQTARQDASTISGLDTFEWPPFTRDMLHRIEALLTVYRIIFPDRPMERLSKEEVKRLREALIRTL